MDEVNDHLTHPRDSIRIGLYGTCDYSFNNDIRLVLRIESREVLMQVTKMQNMGVIVALLTSR